MRVLNVFVFLFAFNINVQVKAEVKTAPVGCLKEKVFPCLIKSDDPLLEMSTSDLKIFAQKGLILQLDDAKNLTLISGRIWVKVKRKLNAKYTSGKALLSKGLHEIEFSREKTFFRPLLGRVLLRPKGHENPIEIPVGYENEIMSVGRDGKAVVGVPRPADLKQAMHGAGLFYRTSRRLYDTDMKEYYKHWSDAIENSSRMNRYIAAREVGKQEDAERSWLERKRLREAERNQLRQKFWNKVFR